MGGLKIPFCLLIVFLSLGLKISHAKEADLHQPATDSLVVDGIEWEVEVVEICETEILPTDEDSLSVADVQSHTCSKNKTKKIRFFKRLRRHYKKGNGEDFILSSEEFDYLINHGRIMLDDVQLGRDSCYIMYIKYYDPCSPNDLKFSFGTATVKFSLQSDQFVGFHDKYDFDGKPIGQRNFFLELLTRIAGTIVSGTPFEIYYDKSYFVNE